MWYRKSSKPDPSYEVKIITDIVEKALEDLFYKQLNYNPSSKELGAKKKILLNKLEEENNGLDNIRHNTKGNLTPYIKDMAYLLFKKKV
jgi:hypothetical protein